MKIAFILPGIPAIPSGGLKIAFEYANYLAEHGHTVTLCYLTDQSLKRLHLPEAARKALVDFGVKFYPRWFQLDKRLCRMSLFSMAQLPQADIVIATAIRTAQGLAGYQVRQVKKAYLIQGFENWVVPDEEVYKSYSAGMTNITVASWLSEIVDAHAQSPSVCISNGIDEKVFTLRTPLPERKAHTLAFQYHPGEYKGCVYALEAVRILEKQYPDLKVLVVGRTASPPDLPKSCRYHRQIPPEKVAQINNEVQVFMCSSIEEGFGLPGLEAMACGCALVSSAYKGVMEYAQDGLNALLVPMRDAQALADAVSRLFEDAALRERIAQNALSTAQTHTVRQAAARFERVLMEI